MRTLMLMLCLLALPSLVATEYDEARYDDGSLQYKIKLDRDGKRHGKYTLYHPSGDAKRKGEKAEVGSYNHGQLHGTRTIIDAEGEVTAEEQWRDGALILPMTSRFIKQRLAQIGKEAAAAVAALPEGDGSWKDRKLLAQVLERVNYYRLVCGLPDTVVYKADYMQKAQCAAEVQDAIGTLNHYPKKNPGIPEERWPDGREGSHGNLAMGTTGVASIDAWMDDSDDHNKDRVGHRRWFLCVGLKEMGYGDQGRFATAYVVKPVKEGLPRVDIVSFPARGMMPLELFGAHYCWSVSPDPKRYDIGKDASIEIRPYDMKSGKTGEALEIDYRSLQNQTNAMPPPAIIARPKGLPLSKGAIYQVTVTGVKPKADDCAPLTWITLFY